MGLIHADDRDNAANFAPATPNGIGGYWSSTASPSVGHLFTLNFTKNGYVNPSNRAYMNWANPIRCVR